MALQRKFNFPKANMHMMSGGRISPETAMELIRIMSKVYGPVTEEIRGDFSPKPKGKIRELLEKSAKEITL